MLHLNDRLRFKMGKSVLKYFKVLYGLMEPTDDLED